MRDKKAVIFMILFFSLACAFISSFASAGLVLNASSFAVNKTIGISSPITLMLKNTEAFPFYNISFSSNPYIQSSLIDVLQPGATATYLANVVSDSFINANIKIQGYYISTVGQLNNHYQINITSYSSQVSPCDFSIIKGDTVTWRNLKTQDFQMFDATSGALVDTIPANGSSIKTFSDMGTFKYQLKVSGISLPSSCTITILNDNGYVNNPSYDALLNLIITPNYPSTTISTSFITSNYSMNFYDTQQGIFSVTNTGNVTAHGVQISADWMSFSPNAFDLEPGITKGIVYSINPIILATNETNKDYTKSISLIGNFPQVSQDMKIHINYADISVAGNSSSQDANYLLNVFCPKFPTSILCGQPPQTVYKYVQNGSQEINVTTTTETLNKLFGNYLDQKEEMTIALNYYKEKAQEQAENNSQILLKLENLSARQQEADRQQQETMSSLSFAFVIVGLLVIAALIFLAIRHYRLKNLEEKHEDFNA